MLDGEDDMGKMPVRCMESSGTGMASRLLRWSCHSRLHQNHEAPTAPMDGDSVIKKQMAFVPGQLFGSAWNKSCFQFLFTFHLGRFTAGDHSVKYLDEKQDMKQQTCP
jgi:hypothetical protein